MLQHTSVSGLGSGFCRALVSRLGWRLAGAEQPSQPRASPTPPLGGGRGGGGRGGRGGGEGGGGWKRQTPDHMNLYMRFCIYYLYEPYMYVYVYNPLPVW